jgi:hypothetical protein
MPNDICPDNIMEIITWYCRTCQAYLDDPKCPKCNANMSTELPPLGVYVTDTTGVTSKVV